MAGIRRKIASTLPAFFQATGLKPFANDSAYSTAKGSPLETGDAYFNTTTGFVRVYDGSQFNNVITEDSAGDTSITNDLNVGGNTVITGNLTVNGTTTTVNTSTLDVEDLNITINNGGDQASADDAAGLTVEMSDATDASLIYDKDATSHWRIGEVGSEIEVATISDTQTLTNKTIGDFLTFTETTAPSPPSSTELQLYAKDDAGISVFETQDSNGNLVTLNEDVFLIARNTSGSTINKGQVVYITGSTGARPTVDLAQADAISTSRILGIAKTDISNNSFGRIITQGVIKNFDTSSFTAGDVVFLSPTTPGAFTTTRPSAPNLAVGVGVILSSGVGNGSMSVDIRSISNEDDGTINNDFSIGDGTAGAKTLTYNNDNSGVLSWNPTASRTLTLPDTTDTLVGRDTTDTLTNKTIDGDDNTIQDLALSSLKTSGNTNVFIQRDGSGNVIDSTKTVPSGDVVGTSDTQTLTNKTIDADLNTISNLEHGLEVDNPISGVHGVTGNVVGTSDTQTLTNKTINSPTIDSATMTTHATFDNQAELRLREQTGSGTNYVGFSAPDAVTSNQIWKLPDGDGNTNQALITDGSGNLDWGDAGGGTGKNYIDSASAQLEGGTGSWATFEDTGSYVDGTGGSPATISISQTTASANVLAETGSLDIAKAATDGSGEGVSIDSQTIDRADEGRKLYWEFEIDATDANYTSEDLVLYAYDKTNSAEIPLTVVFGAGESANGRPTIRNEKTKVIVEVLPNSDTADIRLSLYLDSDSATASAWNVYIDAIKLSPDTPIPGAIVTPWQEYTVSITSTGTNPSKASSPDIDKAFWRRVGDSVEIEYTYVHTNNSGASAGTGTYLFSLPSGLAVDASKITESGQDDTAGYAVGTALFSSDTAAERGSGSAKYEESTGLIQVSYLRSDGTFTGLGATESLASSTFRLSFKATLPIEGWDASGLVSTTENLFKNTSSRIYLGSNQNIASTGATKVQLDTIDYDNLNIADTANNKITIKRDGLYFIYGQFRLSNIANTDSSNCEIHINGVRQRFTQSGGAANNAVSLGVFDVFELSKDDEIEVFTNSASDANYDILAGSESSWLTVVSWRDLSVFGVTGNTELIEASSGQIAYPITADQWGDLTSIDLPPGEWDIVANAQHFNSGGSVTTTKAFIGISTTAGNSNAGLTEGINGASTSIHTTANGGRHPINLSRVNETVSQTTTYYLKGRAETSITNFDVAYKISARRVK